MEQSLSVKLVLSGKQTTVALVSGNWVTKLCETGTGGLSDKPEPAIV